MTFKLYEGSSEIWMETQSSVEVVGGIFNVLLGSVTPLDTVRFNRPLLLGIKVGADAEISPRTPMAAAAYARAMPGMYTFFREDVLNRSYNVVGGAANNIVGEGVVGATIGGGGGFSTFVIPANSFRPIPNSVLEDFATVGGGESNTASGILATIPGGAGNSAKGRESFAAGHHAKANHDGTFVWNDRSITTDNDSLVSTGENQFLIRAAGGVGIGTNAPSNQLTVAGDADITGRLGVGTATPNRELTVFDRDNNGDAFINIKASNAAARELLIGVNQSTGGIISMQTNNNLDFRTNGNSRLRIRNTGQVGIARTFPPHPLHVGTNGSTGNGAHVTAGGTWTDGSSRTFKEDLRRVEPSDVLQSVVRLPVYRWRYKDSNEGDHMGPVAEISSNRFILVPTSAT